ncbi:MAG: Gfo/Idh/MocA family oxidoreductase [Verrucomicrobiae bacterium]|nr:Gfo/Idh/MocA family oxidoreductase [Verrucomicrobiae bacterium]
MNSSSTPSPVSRRQFISTAGAATASALTASRFAFAQASDTLKLALIGCGGRGSGAANQALNVPGTRLVAVADAFQDRLESALSNLKQSQGDKVDVPADRQFVGFDAYKNAIALADVVILATPPGFRPMHFEEAVRQGKHVFAEKPVATDGPGVRRFLAAAEEAKRKNLKVGIGLQRHHQPGYLETVRRLHDGAIGEIHTLRVYWNDGGVWVNPRKPGQTEIEYQMRNWYYFNWLCGDHIVEQHIHNLDVANWVKNGYPVKARGLGGRQVRTDKQFGEIYDHHAVEFFYADGSTAFSQCRHIRGCWNEVNEHAVGTKGFANIGGHQIKEAAGEGWRFKSERQVDPYQQEHDDLFAAIRNNTSYNEAFNGAKSTLTAILGRFATYSGVEISWEQALNSELNLFPDRLAWDAQPKSQPDAEGFYKIAMPGQWKLS